VSGRSPGATWQRPELVGAFLRERKTLMPLLDVQEDLLRHLLDRHPHPVGRFLDLGSGDGAMSELLLSLKPEAEAVLVDFSEPMLEGAERRLARSAARWQLVRADLSDPTWAKELSAVSYGAAVSAFSIHHLPGARKRDLFAELYRLLEPGAMFVNMDYVSIHGPLQGLWDEQMRANAVRAERERGGSRSAEELEREFDDGDDDRPDSAEDQVHWLRDAGFGQAEIHFKWAEAAIFGAIKPAGADAGRKPARTGAQGG
jgi:ubiquinone/menaquinone biosynthesis C-methylase UbiE